MDRMIFQNRQDAGQQLAHKVKALVDRTPALADPVVLALPRGGLPVATEVAGSLHAPLDLLFARKIGAPCQRELAIGAVVDGDAPQLVVNEDVLARCGLTDDAMDQLAVEALDEIERRRRRYLRGRNRVSITGRPVIIVDDGIATGATFRAALKGLKRQKTGPLVLAVPVASPVALRMLKPEVDHLVYIYAPDPLYAVGAHYKSFRQLSDDEVAHGLMAFDLSGAKGQMCGAS